MHSIAATLRAGSRRASRISLCSSSPAVSSSCILTSRFRFFSSFTGTSAASPLLKLQNAQLKSLQLASTPTLNWTINDAGKDECWAIIAPASEQGGAVRRELIDLLAGRLRPRKAPSNLQHPPPHPFLLDATQPDAHPRPASQAIKHVSFATKMGSSSTSGEFINYSARYGAIRDQDRITLYERLMDLLHCPVGLVAAQKLVPDPFANASANQVGLFKYKSDADRQNASIKAQQADKVIKQMAPLLLITDELLHRPVIALSNGQTRRARILSSLITGAELVVLEEPFSGIDATTRVKLSDLFAELHAGRRPRLVLVLREQDAVPDLVTHILRINDEGQITALGPRQNSTVPSASSSSKGESTQGGPNLILSNFNSNIGRGNTCLPPLISLQSVSIQYGSKTVLDNIDLNIHPGDRLVLAGDNGSGKTTLLALLLGDHPKSFSFPSSSLSLFGHARDHPSNARTLLNRRLGHLSPELFNAFPRKPLAAGGLTVGEVVASGFENVFAHRAYTERQKERVYALLGMFRDLITSPSGAALSRAPSAGADVGDRKGEDVKQLSDRGFNELSNGSQAVVLFLRAVVGNPQLLVLDEPFQGMDKRQVERTRNYIDRPQDFAIGATQQESEKDLKQRKEMAIVLVSHYESEWPLSFGSLLRLGDGKVVERI